MALVSATNWCIEFCSTVRDFDGSGVVFLRMCVCVHSCVLILCAACGSFWDTSICRINFVGAILSVGSISLPAFLRTHLCLCVKHWQTTRTSIIYWKHLLFWSNVRVNTQHSNAHIEWIYWFESDQSAPAIAACMIAAISRCMHFNNTLRNYIKMLLAEMSVFSSFCPRAFLISFFFHAQTTLRIELEKWNGIKWRAIHLSHFQWNQSTWLRTTPLKQ